MNCQDIDDTTGKTQLHCGTDTDSCWNRYLILNSFATTNQIHKVIYDGLNDALNSMQSQINASLVHTFAPDDFNKRSQTIIDLINSLTLVVGLRSATVFNSLLKTVSTFGRNGNVVGVFKDSVNAAVTFAGAEGRANQLRYSIIDQSIGRIIDDYPTITAIVGWNVANLAGTKQEAEHIMYGRSIVQTWYMRRDAADSGATKQYATIYLDDKSSCDDCVPNGSKEKSQLDMGSDVAKSICIGYDGKILYVGAVALQPRESINANNYYKFVKLSGTDKLSGSADAWGGFAPNDLATVLTTDGSSMAARNNFTMPDDLSITDGSGNTGHLMGSAGVQTSGLLSANVFTWDELSAYYPKK
ncbi:hypothetical protein AB5N19_11599 [Seiridium cardinale]